MHKRGCIALGRFMFVDNNQTVAVLGENPRFDEHTHSRAAALISIRTQHFRRLFHRCRPPLGVRRTDSEDNPCTMVSDFISYEVSDSSS